MSRAEADPPQLLGRERVPLWTADDCHPDPAGLRAHALAQRFARRSGDYYPGLRAPVPPAYEPWAAAMLARLLGTAADRAVTVVDCTFAIACDDPAAAAPIQLIPHFDSLADDLVAAVHYLSDPPFGGTAFYRHRRTGFERIGADRVSAWQAGLAADAREFGLPAGRFPGASDALFERTGQAALRCNRLICYPANCLHAGLLGHGSLSTEPAAARLTITTLARLASPLQGLQ